VLSKEELIQISEFSNLKPWQQEKHYVQCVALAALAKEPLVFKGGTFLWFFCGLKRFSEDLDFTARGKIDGAKLVNDLSMTLEQFGIENSFKVLSDDDFGFSFRVNAKGPLYSGERSAVFLYVEISKREELLERGVSFSLNTPYNLPTKVISGMDLKEVASEKVRAIMTRDKARDVFDSYFLAKKGIKLDLGLVEKKLAFYGKKFDKKSFIKKIDEKKSFYLKELKPMVFEELPSFEEAKKTIKENWL